MVPHILPEHGSSDVDLGAPTEGKYGASLVRVSPCIVVVERAHGQFDRGAVVDANGSAGDSPSALEYDALDECLVTRGGGSGTGNYNGSPQVARIDNAPELGFCCVDLCVVACQGDSMGLLHVKERVIVLEGLFAVCGVLVVEALVLSRVYLDLFIEDW